MKYASVEALGYSVDVVHVESPQQVLLYYISTKTESRHCCHIQHFQSSNFECCEDIQNIYKLDVISIIYVMLHHLIKKFVRNSFHTLVLFLCPNNNLTNKVDTYML